MVSSHPEPKNRAEIAKGRAQADGLYKPYVAKPINNKATTTKVPAKKATKKK
jgi:putative metalloprotease